VIDLGACCFVADCAGWLFSEDYCAVFAVFGVVVGSAHSASALASRRLLAVECGCVSCRARLGCLCFVFNITHVLIKPSAIAPRAFAS
jgi:hypothetical protein